MQFILNKAIITEFFVSLKTSEIDQYNVKKHKSTVFMQPSSTIL